MKKYERGDLPKSDWLDKMAFRKMEEIHAVRLGEGLKVNYLTLFDRQRLKNLKISSFTLTCLDSISL